MSVIDDAIAYFMTKGWTRAQAAGAIGNAVVESGGNLDTKAIGDGGNSVGIFQWHPDRQAGYSAKYGGNIKDATLYQQLDYADYELRQGNYRTAGQLLGRTTTPSEAATVFMNEYERPNKNPNINHIDKRIAAANAGYAAAPASVFDNILNTIKDAANIFAGGAVFAMTPAGTTASTNPVLGFLEVNGLKLVVGLVGIVVIVFGVWQVVREPALAAQGIVKGNLGKLQKLKG